MFNWEKTNSAAEINDLRLYYSDLKKDIKANRYCNLVGWSLNAERFKLLYRLERSLQTLSYYTAAFQI